MKKKLLFIVNPKAGTGSKKPVVKHLENFCAGYDGDSNIIFSAYKNHARELAAEAVNNKISIIVAVGGDGTVNEVAKPLLFSSSCLGIIPCGSGNGLARHFKIPMDVTRALQVIEKGKELTIDTLQVNEHFSINISGIGFDARIARLFAENQTRGLLTYLKLTIKEIFSYRPLDYQINMAGQMIDTKALFVIFANTTQWGNNAIIAPGASPTDGLITLGILRNLPLLNIPSFVIKLFNGHLQTSKLITYHQLKELTVKSTKPMNLHIDGETVKDETSIQVKVTGESLKINIP